MRTEDDIAKCTDCRLEFQRRPSDPDVCPRCDGAAVHFAACCYVDPVVFDETGDEYYGRPSNAVSELDYHGTTEATQQNWSNRELTRTCAKPSIELDFKHDDR